MPNYQIIPITPSHIESFWSAVDSVARERKYLSFLEGPPIESTHTYVLGNIQGNWPHLVAVNEGKVLGWCDITSLDRPIYAHSGALGIGVVDGYRGQGMGEELMRAALEKARARGLTRVELIVREGNKAAIGLYRKLGFEVEGLHRNAVRIEGVYENHVSMGLLFE